MTNLSDVFKYISHFRHAGHQVGRKVGDMLEVLTYASIARDNEILSRLQVEPKLFGFSDAGHKVEFTILDEARYNEDGKPTPINGGSITDTDQIIGFIECKKVGVEQTVNGTFKKAFTKHDNRSFKVPFDAVFNVNFSPRGADVKHKFEVSFCNNKINIKEDGTDEQVLSEELHSGHRIIFALSDLNTVSIIGNDGSLRDFNQTLKNCRILEIIDIKDDYYVAILNDCLAGPQTPEKAKQSSFVALDVRRKRFGSFDKRESESEMLSVLVMTEFSHWEEKSQNMIRACIDRNFVIEDNLIIDAFVRFEEKFGDDFYNRITKDSFENDNDVRELALQIVNEKNGRIFRDIDDNRLYTLTIEENKLKYR